MGLRALALSSPLQLQTTNFPSNSNRPYYYYCPSIVSAKQEEEPQKKKKKTKPISLFTTVTDALDFSQVRSPEDAELLEDAREATKSGARMSRQQYGALRRKIGGTYKDFFKSYVEVDGEYVEEGWVDKTCKVCNKDTKGEARQVDKFGRYVHVSCLEKSKSGNFFSRFFSFF